MREKLMNALLRDIEFELRFTSFSNAASPENIAVTGIAYASHEVVRGDVFFCVPGLKSDGHQYAHEAIERGATALVVERFLDEDICQFKVADARRALALASARYFDLPSEHLALAGVTGTNGKTTTTYLMEWVAHFSGNMTGLIGTVETRIAGHQEKTDHTTPESYDLQKIFRAMVDAGVEYAFMEVSSHAISLNRIAGTKFSVCGFSNLTQDHLDYHGDMEHYFQAKADLFRSTYCQRAAVCIDDVYGRRLYDQCTQEGISVLTCGFNDAADIYPQETTYRVSGSDLLIKTPEGEFALAFPLIGRFNVENLLLTAALCRQLGFAYETIFSALEQVPQVPGRFERVVADTALSQDFSVFVDYSHTPDSIEKALQALRPITTGRIIIVFGCGGDRDRGKRPKMAVAARAADFIIVTSDNPRTEDPRDIIEDIIPGLDGFESYEVITDRRDAIYDAIKRAQSGDSILIAGKGHEDYQLIGDRVLSFDDRIVAAEALTQVLS
jgi:UDP-N-acetylmuramoyl-L-alanyl-D-glutamate--2,6-diaminopimelate ligase